MGSNTLQLIADYSLYLDWFSDYVRVVRYKDKGFVMKTVHFGTSGDKLEALSLAVEKCLEVE